MNEDDEALRLRKITGRLLTERQRARGLSLRKIEEASGVSKTAVARILSAESGYYMENFDAVARALGLVPWKIYKQAEDELKANKHDAPAHGEYSHVTYTDDLALAANGEYSQDPDDETQQMMTEP